MWLLQWILKAAIFFTLFAFALNNQDDAVVHFFFGTQWRAPLVLVVLAAFTCGVAVGVLGMVPRWWRQRQAARQVRDAHTAAPSTPAAASANTPQEASGGA
ncbi:MAG: LapA family protein [Betaproteobacteria bacterium]|nr:LapA family protein [Betaproteobacteria bacterium]